MWMRTGTRFAVSGTEQQLADWQASLDLLPPSSERAH